MQRLKNLYEELKKNGELIEMFPSLSGTWEKDKKAFQREQNYMESYSANLNYEDFDAD